MESICLLTIYYSMRLWTSQKIGFYEDLMNNGIAYCNQLGYFAKENNFAYKWMVEQMKQRIGEPPLPQITLPVWAWYQYSSRKKNKPPLSPIDKGHDGREMMMEILCTTTSKNPKHPSHALVRQERVSDFGCRVLNSFSKLIQLALQR